MGDESLSNGKSRRPIGVWIISIFYFITASLGLLGLIMIFSGSIQDEDDAFKAVESLGVFGRIVVIAVPALNILGAMFLFTLRRHAFQVLLTAFIINVFSFVYQVLAGFSTISEGIIAAFIGLVVVLYTRDLVKKEILE